ncbi:MAG: hemerythrin domain-containing protein [Deltaproteobacteria bacterium]|nr:hemerythrin domain-containing protein [Deltaproteobacteria bacterium]
MLPSEAREELLSQHAELRRLLSLAATLAGQVLADAAAGTPSPSDLPELHRLLARLQSALSDHNKSEESLLEPMLRDADAWGPQRVARMVEEHKGEHSAFRKALEGEDLDVAARLPELAEELEAHMLAEERTFLSAGVLRDDCIVVESSS